MVKAEEKEEIKGTVDVFWQQNNIYLNANIQKQEEVHIKITSTNKHKLVFEDKFYLTTGFKFFGKPG